MQEHHINVFQWWASSSSFIHIKFCCCDVFSVVAREACCITILMMARWRDLKVPPLQKVSTKEMGLAQSLRNLGLADSACGE